MSSITPFVRYAAHTRVLPNAFFVKSRDCRLFYVTEGSGFYRYADEAVPLHPGVLVFTPPGIKYMPQSDSDTPLKFYTINFDFDMSHSEVLKTQAPSKAENFDMSSVFTPRLVGELEIFNNKISLENMQELEADLLELWSDWQSKEIMYKEMTSAKMAAIIIKIARACFAGKVSVKVTDRVIKYVEQHYMRELTNESIAKAMNYHPYYISKLIKERTGMTLHKYLTEIRMQKAVELLLNTEMSVAEIAGAVGYGDPNHFSTTFHRLCGSTPSIYRSVFKSKL